MEQVRSDRSVTLDSAQIRCLAHPLRSRLLVGLRSDGPQTSSQLARALDTNTGATSYHLRQLAEVGLVTEVADRGTARERWWQSAHDFSTWNESDFDDDPDDRAAAEWLIDEYERTKQRWRDRWIRTRGSWSVEWREASSASDIHLDLTSAELARLHRELVEVVMRYRREAAEHRGRDADIRRVAVLLDGFPFPEPER